MEEFDYVEALKKLGEAFEEFKTAYLLPMMKKAKTVKEYEYGTKVTICDTGPEYSIAVEVPGVEKDTLKVEATNFSLSVEGKSDETWEKKTESTNVLLNERDTSEIQRKLTFPEEVKSAEASATLKNGVLYVTLPKKNPHVVGEAIPIRVESVP
jgi:HSP20 family protein